MPGWRTHNFIDRIFFGRSYSKIHRKMDEPFKYFGRSHRVLFHDPASAYTIAESCYPGDPNAILAALLHIQCDELCSADPEYRRYLENMEILSRKKKKRRKGKRMTKRVLIEDSLLSDLKKLVELKRLLRIFYSLG